VSVKIRLQRKGTTNVSFFRIVVADSRSPRDGRFVDQLGYYDPRKNPADIKGDTARVIDWLRKGAQPSGTVRSLLSRVGIMQTWHEMRKGKSLDELAHIEDEARQKMQMTASAQHGRRQAARERKTTAAVQEEPAAAEAEPETPAEPAGE